MGAVINQKHYVESLVRYVRWYEEACCDDLCFATKGAARAVTNLANAFALSGTKSKW
ncbi:conserved hypothetical protein [Ricinus communis]|uniref:Uncharacterized protein n=1 Tax=Ricinus communis TaxID=3988 RepID=B9RSE3_RICCO|nr:conserved hypothetical protein [Ricinus communis]